MQGYQQRLIFFALFITIIYAETKIDLFNPFEIGTGNNKSTIYDNHVKLWADVTDCPQSACACEVRTDGLEDDPKVLTFLGEKKNLGFVDILKLDPNTNYLFTLTCKGDSSILNKTLNVKTDYSRPLAPHDIKTELVSKHVQVTWSPPEIPDDSFSYYKIIIDNNPVPTNVSKSEKSYKMSKEYQYGIIHTFIVRTCYIDNQNEALCSSSNGASASFIRPVTETPSPPPTAAPSTGVHSYSISISMIIIYLYLISKMNY